MLTAERDFDPTCSEREFRVAMSDHTVAVLGSALSTLLDELAPNVRLRIEQLNTGHVSSPLHTLRTIDAVVLPYGYVRDLPRLDLCTDEWVCLVSADNRAVGEHVTIEQLSELPWVRLLRLPVLARRAAEEVPGHRTSHPDRGGQLHRVALPDRRDQPDRPRLPRVRRPTAHRGRGADGVLPLQRPPEPRNRVVAPHVRGRRGPPMAAYRIRSSRTDDRQAPASTATREHKTERRTTMTDRLITHLRHVDLAVPDYDKQVAFYTDVEADTGRQ